MKTVRYIGNTVPDLHGRRGTVVKIDRKGWRHVAFGNTAPVKCAEANLEVDDGECFFGLACPNCGRSDRLDIAAIVCVRVVGDVNSDDAGTDADEARDMSHEWSNDSAVQCCACDWFGTVRECSL